MSCSCGSSTHNEGEHAAYQFPANATVDWAPMRAAFNAADPKPAKVVRMRLQSIEHEGTIAERRVYVNTDAVTLQGDESFTVELSEETDSEGR